MRKGSKRRLDQLHESPYQEGLFSDLPRHLRCCFAGQNGRRTVDVKRDIGCSSEADLVIRNQHGKSAGRNGN